MPKKSSEKFQFPKNILLADERFQDAWDFCYLGSLVSGVDRSLDWLDKTHTSVLGYEGGHWSAQLFLRTVKRCSSPTALSEAGLVHSGTATTGQWFVCPDIV